MKKRIVFMGTPEFAVPTLKALIAEDQLEVVAVVTSVDKPGGRGRKQILQSAVKTAALEHGLNLLQPRNLKSPHFIRDFEAYKPDLAVVVAFRMLPEVIWSFPKFGTINLHASLLPAYRGAAPINWAIINGERETGLTTFLISKEIDTGNVIFQKKMSIAEDETAGSLHDRMMNGGAELVVESVKAVMNGQVKGTEQDHRLATKAPKIFHEHCRIDVTDSARNIHNFIRGLSPYPGAWIKVDDKIMKVYQSAFQEISHNHAPGLLVTPNGKDLNLYTSDGYITFIEVQLQGKKKMTARSFLNGYDLSNSSIRLESR